MKAVTVLVAILCIPLSGPAAAQCTPQQGQLGCVTVVDPTGCPSGPSTTLTGTNTCQLWRIDCFGVPSMWVELRITEPAGGTTRGTALLGTGGTGVEFYENVSGGEVVAQDLVDHGFRVVQRKWTGSLEEPVGWIQQGYCLVDLSCRYATLADEVFASLHTTGGSFVVTGNSGGSGEIGYALSTWGLTDLIDVAVLSAGPPFARLDYFCNNAAPWPTLCPGLVPPGVMACGGNPLPCLFDGGLGSATCTLCSAEPTNQHLHEDSILNPTASTLYEGAGHKTRVHFIVGSNDCEGIAAPGAVLFHDAIQSEKVLEFVSQTPHWVPQSSRGQDAIVRALLAGAACPDSAATISPDSWPIFGTPVSFALEGPTNGMGLLFYAIATLDVETEFGWWFLENAIGLGTIPLDATGAGTAVIGIPNDPGLVGLEVFVQALYDDGTAFTCTSNLTSFVVRG